MRGKEHVPTDETRALVRQYIRDGISHEHIGAALGISHDTLTRKYDEEIAPAAADFNLRFERTVKARLLLIDCPPVLHIWGTKALLGWRDTVAIDPNKEAPSEALTDEQLRARIAERARQLRDGSAASGRPRATGTA